LRASEPEPGALLSIVLAAGRGRRFERLSRDLPKPLWPVLDRPLLAWHLAALRRLGVRQCVLVIGHLGAAIRTALGDGAAHGVALEYVVQPEPLGIADALARAGARLDRPFLCLLGDVLFDPADLAPLAAALAGADAALGVRAEAPPEELARNFAVEVDADGWVRAVEEKPAAARSGRKGIGLYAFRPDFVAVARETPPSGLRGERELTDAIQRYVAAGARVRAVECTGRDFNLAGPADLLAANLHALACSGRSSFVAASAAVAADAELGGAVVLERAPVAPGARRERARVLAGERVPAGSYADALFVAGEVVACPPRR
jgi:dTDP-glucose pyrophosphorylase